MFYIVFVLLTLVVGPIVGTVVDVAVTGRSVVIAGTFWFVFFGGIRLLIAGLSQALRPGFTVGNVLGQQGENPGANYMTQELGYANVGIGLLGVVGPWLGWAPAGGLAMGVFLVLAGLRHIAKPGKHANEWFATISDLAFGVVVLVGFALSLVV